MTRPSYKTLNKTRMDTAISIRFEKKQLEKFKKICGKNYQKKIKELVQMYIDAYDRRINDQK